MVYLILATQTSSPLFVLPKGPAGEPQFDGEIVGDIFENTLSNTELAHGLLILLKHEKVSKAVPELDPVGSSIVKQGLEIGKEILGRAV